MKKKNKKWNDYLWIATALYFVLGLFNIMFAWLGMICFMIPLILTFMGKGKLYCNSYCGRSQLFNMLGEKKKLSRNRPTPDFLAGKPFRYGFLVFFMTMFFVMVFNTYLVFQGARDLKEVITLLWTFKVPWNAPEIPGVAPWAVQFAFGFYSMMLTSGIIGTASMYFYRPRSWCSFCPIGTMTQEINKVMHKKAYSSLLESRQPAACSACAPAFDGAEDDEDGEMVS